MYFLFSESSVPKQSWMYLGFKLSLFSFMLMCTGNLAYGISDMHVCWVIELVLEMPCYSMLFQPSNTQVLMTLYLTDSPGLLVSVPIWCQTKYVHLFGVVTLWLVFVILSLCMPVEWFLYLTPVFPSYVSLSSGCNACSLLPKQVTKNIKIGCPFKNSLLETSFVQVVEEIKIETWNERFNF